MCSSLYLKSLGIQTTNLCKISLCFVRRNSTVGKEWLEQAGSDLQILKYLCDSGIHPSTAHHVCFLAHQVAEKSLKAARFAVFGVDERSLRKHGLKIHATALESKGLLPKGKLSTPVMPLESHYLYTRYPNCYTPHQAPMWKYKEEHARDAMRRAEQVYKLSKTILMTHGQQM